MALNNLLITSNCSIHKLSSISNHSKNRTKQTMRVNLNNLATLANTPIAFSYSTLKSIRTFKWKNPRINPSLLISRVKHEIKTVDIIRIATNANQLVLTMPRLHIVILIMAMRKLICKLEPLINWWRIPISNQLILKIK